MLQPIVVRNPCQRSSRRGARRFVALRLAALAFAATGCGRADSGGEGSATTSPGAAEDAGVVSPMPSGGAAGAAAGSGEPGGSPSGGVGGAAAEVEVDGGDLCDGSDEPRLAYVQGYGFAPLTAVFFGVYGARFLVVDGQCRYWRGRGDGIVWVGTLSRESADELARGIALEQSRSPAIPESTDCLDAGSEFVWTPSRRLECPCGCSGGTDPSLFETASTVELGLFDTIESGSTGPARLVLSPIDDAPGGADVAPWPLPRAPVAEELETVSLVADSGRLLEDPSELGPLREARSAYLARHGEGYLATPLSWVDPADDSDQFFSMALRDELPAPIARAVAAAMSPAP
jgi:hypothetical protein